ncbi:hypothetical protein EMIHUDRAFT_457417 [Emiliania huxleyi CCMP1516]|uniref:Fungal lipase-like domain-containing protein n=2 Tax=Emiliania huxleyi TaxID=2903 RepID=A0A0D3JRK8_EMIH1|nr:hypothetical protein EMIHUDRAFT_457417 [Emiliania huxleyi CCMP1516]EOD26143.1 hypothetical protein EMIHUDRAFT_457417 [Emiliania huxleyi CCMP1516]|eukprot:XP_005778572.1 hypothetical protein EMIHUDRAFT_457417 [Emiliania huxleyi CCMP1516]
MRARSERRGEALADEDASGGGSSSAAVRIAASHAQDRHLPSPGIRAFAREEVGEEAFTCAVLSAAIYADAPLAPARRPGEESPSASTLLDRLRQHECGLDDAIVLDLSPDGRLAFVARLSGDRPATWTVARGTESGEDVAVDLTYLLLGRPQANPHFKALLRFHDENCRRTERLSELAGFRRYATGHSKGGAEAVELGLARRVEVHAFNDGGVHNFGGFLRKALEPVVGSGSLSRHRVLGCPSHRACQGSPLAFRLALAPPSNTHSSRLPRTRLPVGRTRYYLQRADGPGAHAVRNFLPAGEDPPSSAGAEERPPAHYLFFFDRAGRGKLRVSSHGTVAIGTLLGTGSLRSAAWAFARSILLSSAGRRTAAAAAGLAARAPPALPRLAECAAASVATHVGAWVGAAAGASLASSVLASLWLSNVFAVAGAHVGARAATRRRSRARRIAAGYAGLVAGALVSQKLLGRFGPWLVLLVCNGGLPGYRESDPARGRSGFGNLVYATVPLGSVATKVARDWLANELYEASRATHGVGGDGGTGNFDLFEGRIALAYAPSAHWAHTDVTRPLECGARMLVLEKTPQTRHGPFWLSAEILF